MVMFPLSIVFRGIDCHLCCGRIGLSAHCLCESNTVAFSSQGCTKGPHNKEKPPEPVKPDVTSSGEKDDQKPKFNEYIISAPKPQEAIRRPRLYSRLQA